jgi:hypothetical protein
MRADAEGRAGSYLKGRSSKVVEQIVKGVVWIPYDHPDILPPAQGFIAPGVVGGVLGVVSIDEVPAEAFSEGDVVFDDVKDTGKVELVWKGAPESHREVDFLVALVGPSHDGESCIWTFFPGPPVKPSTRGRYMVQLGEKIDLHGRVCESKQRARDLSITHVKLA